MKQPKNSQHNSAPSL